MRICLPCRDTRLVCLLAFTSISPKTSSGHIMFLSWVFVLVACSFAVHALDGTPIVKPRGPPPLNPPESSIVNHDLGARAAPPQTNSKRLAAGLPPLPPKKKWLAKDESGEFAANHVLPSQPTECRDIWAPSLIRISVQQGLCVPERLQLLARMYRRLHTFAPPRALLTSLHLKTRGRSGRQWHYYHGIPFVSFNQRPIHKAEYHALLLTDLCTGES